MAIIVVINANAPFLYRAGLQSMLITVKTKGNGISRSWAFSLGFALLPI